MSLPEIAGHELQDLIGVGSVGTVYLATGAGGRACAVKVFSSLAVNRAGLGQTLRALQCMPPHRGVLSVLGFEMAHSPYYLATPLIGEMTKDAAGRKTWHSPTLETTCGRLSVDLAWQYVYELADALAWMHKHNIAHGNLRCANVLVEDDPESATRITDAGQGWVGGVHHLELQDHFMYLCPDQAEQPDGFFNGYGQSWDVYSFGVVAYRLITGQFPRGVQAWSRESALQQQSIVQGLGYSINGDALLGAVKAQPRIVWPAPAQTKWEERRRQILERAMDFDSNIRWKDAREITRELEILESDYVLEECRERMLSEQYKLNKKVAVLHALWRALFILLGLAAAYAALTTSRAKTAEVTIIENLAAVKGELAMRDMKIGALAAELKKSEEAKMVGGATLQQVKAVSAANLQKVTAAGDANLQRAQAMVDQLITQLLQLPQGNNLEIAFSKQQLADAAGFIADSLPAMEKNPDMAPERARAYGNLGMIALKQRRSPEASQYLDKACNELRALIAHASGSSSASQYHRSLGRYCLLLADMRSVRGDGASAMQLLKEATANLELGIQANPKDRNARYEAAQASFDYGVRSRLEGNAEESSKALERVSVALDEKSMGAQLMPEESFLLARAEMERGLALRDADKLKESVTVLIAAVEKMATLVAGSSPRNQEQAIVTAEAYTELAGVVGRAFTPKEAIDAHTEALKLIYELTRIDPGWTEAKYLLARNLGEIAGLERDTGNASEAYKKKADAIQQINEVVAEDKGNPRYLFEQAKLVGELAEIMGEMGKAKEGVVKAAEAIVTLEDLIKTLPEVMTAERKQWEIQLALVYGIHGQLSESAKQRDAARQSFSSAAKQWERLARLDKDNEVVKRGLDWTQNRLQKLR